MRRAKNSIIRQIDAAKSYIQVREDKLSRIKNGTQGINGNPGPAPAVEAPAPQPTTETIESSNTEEESATTEPVAETTSDTETIDEENENQGTIKLNKSARDLITSQIQKNIRRGFGNVDKYLNELRDKGYREKDIQKVAKNFE